MIGSITELWTALATWIVATVQQILPLFYNTADDELTILGIMVVVSVGIGLFLLLMNIVTSFFGFRQ